MRKLAFFALAIVAVGCSADPQQGRARPPRRPSVEPGVTAAQVRAFDKLQLETGRDWTWMQHEDYATPAAPLRVAHRQGAPRSREVAAAGDRRVRRSVPRPLQDEGRGRRAAPHQVRGRSPLDDARAPPAGRARRSRRRRRARRALRREGAPHVDRRQLHRRHPGPRPRAEDLREGRARRRRSPTSSRRTKSVDESKLTSGDGKLVVFARAGRPAALAFEYTVRAVYGDEPAIWVTKVDAKTGEILDRYNNLQTIEATGAGVLGDAKTFQVAQSGGAYAMTDTSRGVTISTYDAGGQQVGPAQGATQVTSTTLTSWDTGTGRGAAVDAHVYAGVVFDYYKKVHARNAIDGAGGAMLSTAHFGQAYDNAFWDGTGMSYGDGGSALQAALGRSRRRRARVHARRDRGHLGARLPGPVRARSTSPSATSSACSSSTRSSRTTRRTGSMGENIAKTSTGAPRLQDPGATASSRRT